MALCVLCTKYLYPRCDGKFLCRHVFILFLRRGAVNYSPVMGLTPTGPGLTLALVSIILLALSWVTVIGRLLVRRNIKGIGTDDWFMVSGLVSQPTSYERYLLYGLYSNGKYRYYTPLHARQLFPLHITVSAHVLSS